MIPDSDTHATAIGILVNDDKVQLKALSGLLIKDCKEVHSFESVTAALEHMKHHPPPDIIVTDLYMPGIDGWRFCRLLRSPDFFSLNKVPILVVSATFAGEEAMRIARDLGANAFMPSPVDRKKFRDQVQMLLRGEQPRDMARVLIVDDDEVIAQLLKAAFEHHGYQADLSTTGCDAETKFKLERYDFVILDHNLPDSTGLDLLKQFQKTPSNTIFVAITGDHKPELALNWITEGAAAFVTKPFLPVYVVELCAKARRERELLRVEERLETRTLELRESNEIFSSITDNAYDLIAMLDADVNFAYTNKAYEDILGYPNSELSRCSYLNIVHSDDRAKAEKHLRDALKIPTKDLLLRLLCKDGAVKWFQHHANSLQNVPGLFRIVLNARDVTKQVEVEETLRHQVDFQQRLFNSTDAHLAVVDQDGIILKVNQAWRDFAICNSAGDELSWGVGASYFRSSILNHKDASIAVKAYEGIRQVQQGRLSLFELEYPCNTSSEELWFSMRVLPIAGHDGTVLVTHTNITSRKTMEDTLRIRLRYEEAIAKISDTFQADTQDLTLALKHVLLASNADRVYIFENFENDGLCMRQIAEVCAPGIESQMDNPSLQNLYYRDLAPELFSQLSHGRPFGGLVSSLPPRDREVLEKQGISYILILPIQVGGKWYGYLGLDDCTKHRGWEDEDKRLLGTVADLIGRHIERQRAADALSRSQAQLKAVYDHAPVMMCLTDANRRVISMNPAFMEFTNVTPEEINGGSACGIFGCLNALQDPQGCGFSYECAQCNLKSAIDLTFRTGEEQYNIEYNAAWKNKGVYREITLLGSTTLIGPKTEPLLLLCLHDITDRKRNEAIQSARYRLMVFAQTHTLTELLRATLDEAERLTRSMIGFFHFLEEDQKTLSLQAWSTNTELNMCKTEGGQQHYPIDKAGVWVDCVYERRPVIHNDYVSLTHRKGLPPGHAPVLRQLVTPVIRGDKIMAIVGVGNKPEVYTNEDIKTLSSLADLAWDIAERKRMEEEKTKLQTQLIHSQKMESIGRLAGSVAHDFNNMLQAIIVLSELILLDLPAESPINESLTEILNCAKRSTDLTRQLLTFARKQPITPKTLDLNEVVSGMFKMLERLIGEDIKLAWHPGADVWPIYMDVSQIDQILANLCVNARDAIANIGQISIQTENISIEEGNLHEFPGASPGDFVQLSVSDNGAGMSKEIMDRIFEPFFTTKESGKGTGLGLATVYGIVNQNKGFINFNSKSNHGTTFKIFLPRSFEATSSNQAIHSDQVSSEGVESILLVEDSLPILRAVTQLLKSLGYQVYATTTPTDAIRMAEEHRGKIQLLIVDVIMPEMNGRELSKRVTQYNSGLHCLYMSGYSDNVIVHHGVLEKGINFIQKPFTTQELAKKIRDILGK